MQDTLDKARANFLSGVAHFEAGRLADARACFETALAVAPGRPSVLLNLGLTLFRLGDWREAARILHAAAAVNPEHPDVWISLGLARAALADWAAAAEALTRGLALAPAAIDVWLKLGQCRLRLGDATAALAAFEGALAADADCAPAWVERGGVLRSLARLDEAAICFEKALSLGADPELTAYYLASVRGSGEPAAPPRRYVEALFDDYAADFERHLVGELGYRGFEILLRPLLAAGQRYGEVLDLGCGSGLCGALIRPLADAVDGVDLSREMLAEAAKRGVYRELIHADLASFLAEGGRRADLVLAADVFIYVGELAAAFAAIRRLLRPGGRFAFTVEETDDGRDIRLLPSLRYAHSEAYVRRLAADCGFVVRECHRAPIREDQRETVAGLYVHLE